MTKSEWRWSAVCAGVLVLLLGVPVLWGWLSPPTGWQLYRTWAYGGDYTQYCSAMVQGYDGAWLIVNRFTPEPHPAILQYPLYVFLGHIARWLHLPLEVPYAVASLIAIGALVFALYDFAAAFLPDTRDRKLAFLLAYSVGPAWLVSVLKVLIPAATLLQRYNNAFNRPEVNTFLLFAAAPHLPLALALLLSVTATLYRQQQGDGARFNVMELMSRYVLPVLLLGLLNPFSLPTLLFPVGFWWLGRTLQARRVLWKEAIPVVAMGLAALPLVAYNFWIFSQDPFWGRAYGSQNLQISFPLDVVLMGYGVMGCLAIAGAVLAWHSRAITRILVPWAVVVLLMGYLPVHYQRRFSLGLAPLLTVLAVVGWRWAARSRWVRAWRQRMSTRVIGSVLVILLVWGQNMVFYGAYVMSHLGVGAASYTVFQPRALAEAARYLNTRGDQVIVLTCEEIGNLLAGEIRGRVVLGHAGATLDVEMRRKEVGNFFAGAINDDDRRALWEKYHISHILTADVESLSCGAAFVPASEWHLCFNHDGIKVYERIP